MKKWLVFGWYWVGIVYIVSLVYKYSFKLIYTVDIIKFNTATQIKINTGFILNCVYVTNRMPLGLINASRISQKSPVDRMGHLDFVELSVNEFLFIFVSSKTKTHPEQYSNIFKDIMYVKMSSKIQLLWRLSHISLTQDTKFWYEDKHLENATFSNLIGEDTENIRSTKLVSALCEQFTSRHPPQYKKTVKRIQVACQDANTHLIQQLLDDTSQETPINHSDSINNLHYIQTQRAWQWVL